MYKTCSSVMHRLRVRTAGASLLLVVAKFLVDIDSAEGSQFIYFIYLFYFYLFIYLFIYLLFLYYIFIYYLFII